MHGWLKIMATWTPFVHTIDCELCMTGNPFLCLRLCDCLRSHVLAFFVQQYATSSNLLNKGTLPYQGALATLSQPTQGSDKTHATHHSGFLYKLLCLPCSASSHWVGSQQQPPQRLALSRNQQSNISWFRWHQQHHQQQQQLLLVRAK